MEAGSKVRGMSCVEAINIRRVKARMWEAIERRVERRRKREGEEVGRRLDDGEWWRYQYKSRGRRRAKVRNVREVPRNL